MLSENIYRLRRRSGLSQEQLAEKIGVSRQAISKWEQGLSTPELDKLMALGKVFGATIDELAGEMGSDAPKGPPGENGPEPSRARESRAGLLLCVIGAACLLLFGVLTMLRPESAREIGASSTVTINGTGMLMGLSIGLMVLGLVLVLRKK